MSVKQYRYCLCFNISSLDNNLYLKSHSDNICTIIDNAKIMFHCVHVLNVGDSADIEVTLLDNKICKLKNITCQVIHINTQLSQNEVHSLIF